MTNMHHLQLALLLLFSKLNVQNCAQILKNNTLTYIWYKIYIFKLLTKTCSGSITFTFYLIQIRSANIKNVNISSFFLKCVLLICVSILRNQKLLNVSDCCNARYICLAISPRTKNPPCNPVLISMSTCSNGSLSVSGLRFHYRLQLAGRRWLLS